MSPDGAAERAESEEAYADSSPEQATDLLLDTYGEELAQVTTDPAEPLRQADDVLRYTSDQSAVIDPEGPADRALHVSTMPLRTPDGALPDLTLARSGESIAPRDPLVPVTLPDELADGATLDGANVRIGIEGAANSDPESRLVSTRGGEARETSVYPEALQDTDVALAPIARGVEAFAQIRSRESPESIVMNLEMPAGYSVRTVDQRGGLIQDEAGKPLVTIDWPVATDAQGKSVPVSMRAAGNELILDVPHQQEEIAYPVLVDPVFEYWDWIEMRQSSYVGWNTYSNYANFEVNNFCNVFLPNSCDAGGYGLHVRAPSNGGYFYPAGTRAYWYYLAPGTTSYISTAWIYYMRYAWPGSTYSPYGYAGLLKPDGNWSDVQTFTGTNWCCRREPPYSANGGAPRWLIAGLWTGYDVVAPSFPWHYVRVGEVGLDLQDPEPPTVQRPPASELSTQWVDDQEFTITTAVTDPGLGVQKVEVVLPEKTGNRTLTKSEGCAGSIVYGTCPASNLDPSPGDAYETDRFTFRTGNFYDGYQPVEIRGIDPLGGQAHTGRRGFALWIDHSEPALRRISGTLADAEGEQLTLPTYDLHVEARDGWAAIPSSGVRTLEVRDNGEVLASVPEQDCPNDNCRATLDWTLETADLEPGPHNLRIVAADQMGHETPNGGEPIRVVVPEPEVVHAWKYKNGMGGVLTREEWLVPGSNVTRIETEEEIAVRNTVPCAEPSDGAQCDQVSTVTDPEVPSVAPSYSVETGSEENDPQMYQPSQVSTTAAAVQGAQPQAVGPMEDLLEPGQDAPSKGGEYKKFVSTSSWERSRSEPVRGPDPGLSYQTETHTLWVDAATGMPIRDQLIRDPGPDDIVVWDYELLHDNDPRVTPELFRIPPRPGTMFWESVTHNGANEPAPGEAGLVAAGGQAGAEDPGTDYDAYYLGDTASVPAEEGGSSTVSAHSYKELVRDDEPTLYWRLGEDTGGSASDSSGFGRTGSASNTGVGWSPDGALDSKVNDDGAVDLNGTNQRLSTPYQPFLANGTRTFEGWARRDSATTVDTLIAGNGGTGSAPYLAIGGASGVTWAPQGDLAAKTTWNGAWPGTERWVHWALVFNEAANTAELFINGESKGQKTVTVNYLLPGALWAGAWSSLGLFTNGFDGALDELAVYERALTGAEIRAHHAQSPYAGLVRNDNPAVYWRFGESSGAVAEDSSGMNRPGTYVASPRLGATGALRSRYNDNGAVGLDGVAQRVQSTHSPFIQGSVRTFEGWARRGSESTRDALFGGGLAGRGAPYLTVGSKFSAVADQVVWAPRGNTGASAVWDDAWPGANEWVHWALVFDDPANKAELFIDGESKGVRSIGASYRETSPLQVGAWTAEGAHHYLFDGRVDEFAVYDRSLAGAEIAEHYDGGADDAGYEQRLCLNSFDTVYYNDQADDDSTEQNTHEEPSDPNYVEPSLSEPVEEYVAANYEVMTDGESCAPGREPLEDGRTISIISTAPDSALSTAMTEQYEEIAEAAAPGDPDEGVVSIEALGETLDAFVVSLGRSGSGKQIGTALVEFSDATVTVEGPVGTESIAAITEQLERR